MRIIFPTLENCYEVAFELGPRPKNSDLFYLVSQQVIDEDCYYNCNNSIKVKLEKIFRKLLGSYRHLSRKQFLIDPPEPLLVKPGNPPISTKSWTLAMYTQAIYTYLDQVFKDSLPISNDIMQKTVFITGDVCQDDSLCKISPIASAGSKYENSLTYVKQNNISNALFLYCSKDTLSPSSELPAQKVDNLKDLLKIIFKQSCSEIKENLQEAAMLEKAEGKSVSSLAVIVDKDKVLLRYNKKHGGTLFFPGGHIQEEEMPLGCLMRELKQKLSLELTEDMLYSFDCDSSRCLKQNFRRIKDLRYSRRYKHLREYDFYLYRMDADEKIRKAVEKHNSEHGKGLFWIKMSDLTGSSYFIEDLDEIEWDANPIRDILKVVGAL